MSEATDFAALNKLTPAEAVNYLQRRKTLKVTHSWQDLWHEEHAHHFTISRLTSADLLATIQDMITKSVQGDLSQRGFTRDAKAALSAAGWWGETTVIDPASGREVTTRFDAARLVGRDCASEIVFAQKKIPPRSIGGSRKFIFG